MCFLNKSPNGATRHQSKPVFLSFITGYLEGLVDALILCSKGKIMINLRVEGRSEEMINWLCLVGWRPGQ